MPLILYFELFSGFSPAITRSAPMLALLLGQPRFLLLAQEAKKPMHAIQIINFFIFGGLWLVSENQVLFLKFINKRYK